LSLDLSHEEADFDAAPPAFEQAKRARDDTYFEAFDERPRAREPPAHACEQLTVQVPMETLQALTEVFEQLQAWKESAEPADLSAPPTLGHPDAGDSETSWSPSPRSSFSSVDMHGSPCLSMERPIARSLVRRKSECIAVVKSPSWAPAVCVGLPLGASPRHLPVQAAPASTASPRGSLRKTPAMVHLSPAKCVAWHPVTVTKLHHTLIGG